MASIAQTLPTSNTRLAWFWDFLKGELVPYRGRGALVTRTVLASTLVMLIIMTFRLPYGAYGAIYALILSRESLEATANAVWNVVIGFAIAAAYIILGLTLALADPMLRFLWIIGGFFVGFWAMSAFRKYSAAGRFGYLIAITVTLWDRHATAASKVENTLWAVGVVSLASLIALLVEIAFAAFRRSDELIDAMAERLMCVEDLLIHYVAGDPENAPLREAVARLALTGTSRMRLKLRRAGYEPQYAQRMGAVVALTGRLVDLAANLPHFTSRVPETDRERLGRVVNRIREIREDLTKGSIPQTRGSAGEGKIPATLPLLGEMERTVSLIVQAFAEPRSLSVFAPAPDARPERAAPLPPSGWLDSEHLKFAMRGCLAATASYITFNALAWPEISTAVTTCFLTALTTIGASRQKQVLRISGALVGGLGIGMGAQVFVLPYIDSIAGFTVLYIAIIAVATWIATSSPRLSYFGVQLAVAFCLINLQEFKLQISLTVARDRVIGVLLGLLMMWLFFDQLWSSPAGTEMKRTFSSALRLLARLARGPVSKDAREAIEASYVLRETIHVHFDRVRSLADGVLFEFGPSRRKNLELRSYIRQWGPQLRALFVMRIAALKYRLQAPGFELPEAVRLQQQAYDDHSARMLEEMADLIEQKTPPATNTIEDSHDLLHRTIEGIQGSSEQLSPDRSRSLIILLRGIDGLTSSLSAEIAHGSRQTA